MHHWYKTAEIDPDELFQEAYEPDEETVKEVTREVLGPEMTQQETKSSETIYNVEGISVRLWIIVGGQPALSFEDYSFQERYPITDKRWTEEWDRKKEAYPHQDPKNLQGPTYDVLPEGIHTLRKFVDKYRPMKELRERRNAAVPIRWGITSKKVLDKKNRRFCQLHVSFNHGGVSNVYGDKDKMELFHPWWTKFRDFVEPILARAKGPATGYEIFSEQEFRGFLDLLREGAEQKAFKGE